MKKRLYLFVLLIAAGVISGCDNSSGSLPNPSVTEQSAPETAEPSRETAADLPESSETGVISGESAPEEEDSTPAELYIDENGLLTQAAVGRIAELSEEQDAEGSADYTGLFDFDRDGVPEIYFVRHNSGQGLMPVNVFSLDGTEMGSFEGYCRDGFCRLSYGGDCVYVHNAYEHSTSLRHNSVYRLTIEDGRINSEPYLLCGGAVGNKYPLLEFRYEVGGTESSEEEYFSKYNSWLWDGDYGTREANEISICAADCRSAPQDRRGMGIWTAELYNEYISGKNMIRERLGESMTPRDHTDIPMAYSFDDYDGDGDYEAFVVKDSGGETYFLKNGEMTELGKYLFGSAAECARYGGMFITQGFGNSMTCSVYGVANGAPYEHGLSYRGMMIRPHDEFGRMDPENGIFVLYHSEYNATEGGGAHTWTPYPIGFIEADHSWGELPGASVTRDDFADRADVLAVFDEIESEGGRITTAFLRGGRYLNINYQISRIINDDMAAVNDNHYKTYMIQNQVTLIDAGRGIYYDSL